MFGGICNNIKLSCVDKFTMDWSVQSNYYREVVSYSSKAAGSPKLIGKIKF